MFNSIVNKKAKSGIKQPEDAIQPSPSNWDNYIDRQRNRHMPAAGIYKWRDKIAEKSLQPSPANQANFVDSKPSKTISQVAPNESSIQPSKQYQGNFVDLGDSTLRNRRKSGY